MTGARLVLRTAVAVVAALILTAPAVRAQVPSGISRPDADLERSMSLLELGRQLYAGNCSVCHGNLGEGVKPGSTPAGTGEIAGAGPSLYGVGALAADFYLRTGYMPLARPSAQPQRARPQFDEREIRAMTAFVASLGKGPPIPQVDTADADLGHGRELFVEHCAGCHQAVGQGGVVTGGRVPPLEQATARQVAQAIRIGPYLMPQFPKSQLDDRDVRDIARYVEWTHHPTDRGGWGLGNLGPFPEGIVTWLIAAVALIGTCVFVARRPA